MNVNCMLVSVMAEDAIRPGCAGPKRDKVTHHGKEKTARIAENSQLSGRFRRWWQVLPRFVS
jgi:hypothetical protein